MSRYFVESDIPAATKPKMEVFKVTADQVDERAKQARHKRRRVTAIQYAKGASKQNGNNRRRDTDKFPGRKPVDAEKLEEHSRGDRADIKKVKSRFKRRELIVKEKRIAFAAEQAARAEVLLAEEEGFLQGDEEEEFTGRISQTAIRRAVDPESAAKSFDLNLADFGPYKISYTRNGRYLLLGGRRGHMAALDWTSKSLMCEFNTGESVHAVRWLHTENLLAVAQKRWTHVYDSQGVEIHCVKKMNNITSLEYLPYHFLLAGASEAAYLTWLDVSIGKIVRETYTGLGRLNIMCQNPTNAVLLLGHSKGTVTMWTPNMKDPAAKMLVHRQPVRAVTVDRSGNFMATSDTERSVKIWDIRAFKCLHEYKIGSGANCLKFSQKNLLALSFGNVVEVYQDPTQGNIQYPYLRHQLHKPVSDLEFCPYEDVLGIGHGAGFTSILVPGAGEPNFDALESNPYQTVKQRKEAEVKMLLDKIPAELITLDGDSLTGVDAPTLDEQIAERNKKIFIKPANIEFDPRHKMKGKGGSAKRHHIRRTVIEEARKKNLKADLDGKEARREGQPKKPTKVYENVLDRFKTPT